MTKQVSDAVIRRLPRYYRQLTELERANVARTSSSALGEHMGLTASQIRQDFNHFGGFGQQGFGYKVSELRQKIASILGLHTQAGYKMVIVGAGNVGRALAQYGSFAREGYRVMAFFDVNPELVGTTIEGYEVLPVADLERYAKDNGVDIVVLTVPAEAVESLRPMLQRSGIGGVWNFAPVDLSLTGIAVESIHLTDSLMTLTYRMQQREAEE